ERRQKRDSDHRGFGPPPEEVAPPAEEPRESESLAPAASGSPGDSVGFGPPPEEVTPPADESRESESFAPAAPGGTGGSGTQAKTKPSDDSFGAGLL
ncbi:MAG: hypothetical protein IH895_09670, partial [Planctomycetes bacterium]|nr:hypothetical protein [Planctomycetota bacterium]